ncbi:hypothetical protein Pst134EA_000646 [Puccinia striiformis f. sp. tritici]|uniref:hypothetical protein n=1 Tax=Puccinia striiformis f. sp. tritici TaxID=168172 RepID=UPI00200746D7|nr:hypothetical protein Pst134EA_000646 [Puccinia striiformis f. sp. tritici]KAH9473566.1 hypothetical protein Pst134EA_000646 [Puccinia striiformis f. sp. tritici]
MDNSHQDPGITRGGPPGPAINPTITQEETVMEEMEELVMEALEMGGVKTLGEFDRFSMLFGDNTYFLYNLQDSVIKALVFDGHMVLHENLQIVELPAYSILVEYIYESYIEIPTKLLFNSDEQLPNQLAPLDMPGMEEHGENLGQSISQEYELNFESNWSLQPDLPEESKGVVNTPLIFSQSTNPSSLPIKLIPNQLHIQPNWRTFNQPSTQPTTPTPNQFLKGSNSCKVSTINNVSIKLETQNSSTLINNPEKYTHLERKECPEMKEEFYLPYTPYSPPLKNVGLTISVTRKSLVNNEDISLGNSHFSVGLMGPSAKLGEEARTMNAGIGQTMESETWCRLVGEDQQQEVFGRAGTEGIAANGRILMAKAFGYSRIQGSAGVGPKGNDVNHGRGVYKPEASPLSTRRDASFHLRGRTVFAAAAKLKEIKIKKIH